MLVAMTLMAILAAALYASLSAGFSGRRVTEASLEPARRGAAALTLMEADLVCAVAPVGLLAGEFRGQDAYGDEGEPADTILFHTLVRELSWPTPPSPVRRVELSLAADASGRQTVLVRRTVVNLLSPEQLDPAEEILCREVRAFNMAYYDGYAWAESWDSAVAGDALPRAVRVRIVLDVEGREEGYEVSRVFTLPCAQAVQEGMGAEARMGGAR
jgi:type II secretion system protein J